MFSFRRKKYLYFLFSIFLFFNFSISEEIDQDTALELKKFEEGCNNGNAENCNTAASIFFSFGMYEKAFFLYKKGCDELNNSVSCYNIGDFFSNGYDGISKNEEKTIFYWKKACDLSVKNDEKYCGGCYSLGNLFLDKKDIKKALHYYSLDCNKNCCEACFSIEDLYKSKLISKNDYLNIRNKNKTIFETCDFIKRLSQNDEIEE